MRPRIYIEVLTNFLQGSILNQILGKQIHNNISFNIIYAYIYTLVYLDAMFYLYFLNEAILPTLL